jgi:hypothetical protein
MIGRVRLLVLLAVPVLTGCGAMQRPPKATLVELQKNEKKPQVVEAGKRERGTNGWLAKTRRHLDQVAKEIKSDLDFHETEGLEAFGPDALQQVEALRGEMNGPADVTR